MKIKLVVRDQPAEIPGEWKESVLKLRVKGNKQKVKRIEIAITRALAEEEEG